MMLLGDLPLRGAAVLREGKGCFWGISRCAGLLDWRKEEEPSGGSSAARGCWIGERKMMILGDLPLRGAAVLREGKGCFWGISRCVGLLDWRKEDDASGGSPAARGCCVERRQRLLLGDLPLRGAAGLEKGRGTIWGIFRCAGLLDWRKEDDASGGSPAARGCWNGERKRNHLGDLPLRGAAGLEKGR